MALFQKVEQAGNTWRIVHPVTGESLGRVWLTAHIDRLLRDGDLAEAIAGILTQTGATRRASARTAYQAWLAAGGDSVNLSAFSHSLNNDAGVEDGNRHLYIAGNEFGYLHGVHPRRDARLARFIRLANEVRAAEQLGTQTQRNTALDAALDRFRDDGGIAEEPEA